MKENTDSSHILWDQWVPYTEYEKQECDIRLKTGRVIKHVYPNAGYFQRVCGTDKKRIPEELVKEIRYRKYYQDDLCKGDCAINEAF